MNPNDAYNRYIRRAAAMLRLVLAPYFGGKSRMASRLIPLMPPMRHYVEPFGGSAAVLLRRPRAEGREVYSEIKPSMALLAAELRDRPEALIWRLRYTPYHRRGYEEAKARLRAFLDEWTAADAWQTMSQSIYAGGRNGWGNVFNNEKPPPKVLTAARRLGLASVSESVLSQSFNGGGLDGGEWNPSVNGETIGMPTVGSVATRKGAVAADESVHHAQSVFNALGGFGVSVQPMPQPSSASEANRLGGVAASAFVACAQTMYSKGTTFGTNDDNRSSRAYASKAGAYASKAGLVIPHAGARGLDILLSAPPAKCETICDESGEIYDLFASARDFPSRLLEGGVGEVRSAADAIRLARAVLGGEPYPAPADVRAQAAIAETWYGGVLARLLRAQIESRGAREVRSKYAHPTSAILDAPVGEGARLGRWLPLDETPLFHVHERLRGVEIHCADALDVIAEWRDREDALLYLDPPYVHSARKGANDYEFEMSDGDHRRLLALLKGAKAKIIISGYDSPMYESELSGWKTARFDVTAFSATGKNGASEDGRAARREVAWMNYDIDEWRAPQGGLLDADFMENARRPRFRRVEGEYAAELREWLERQGR